MCGIVCLLLVTLWVASFHNSATTDAFVITPSVWLTVEFYHGQTALILSAALPPNTFPFWLHDYPLQNGNELPGFAGFALLRNSKVGDVLMLPFWFLILLVFAVGTASWLPWRFSMRSLLIATTLVAVMLGLAVAFR